MGVGDVITGFAKNMMNCLTWGIRGRSQYGEWTHDLDPSRNPAGCANVEHCRSLSDQYCSESNDSGKCLKAYQSLTNIQQGNPKFALWVCSVEGDNQNVGQYTQHVSCDKVDLAPKVSHVQVHIPECRACP